MSWNSYQFLLYQWNEENVDGEIHSEREYSNFKNICFERSKRWDHLCLPNNFNIRYFRLLHEDFTNRGHHSGEFKASYYCAWKSRKVPEPFELNSDVTLFSPIIEMNQVNHQGKTSLHNSRTFFNRWNQTFNCTYSTNHLFWTLEVKFIFFKKWIKMNFLISWCSDTNKRIRHLWWTGVYHESCKVDRS